MQVTGISDKNKQDVTNKVMVTDMGVTDNPINGEQHIKSPSDTTIYAPALAKRLGTPELSVKRVQNGMVQEVDGQNNVNMDSRVRMSLFSAEQVKDAINLVVGNNPIAQSHKEQ